MTLREEQPVGFLAAWLIPSFRGRRAVLSPELGNAVEPEGARRVYEALYTYLASRRRRDVNA